MLFESFTWDPNKDEANYQKHGVDFTFAQGIFDGPVLIAPSDQVMHGEERWTALGMVNDHLLVVVFTLRENVARIISARKGGENDRKKVARLFTSAASREARKG